MAVTVGRLGLKQGQRVRAKHMVQGHAESGQTFENVAVPRFIMPALSCRRAFRRLDEIAHHPLFRLLPGTDELQANPSVKNI